MSSSEGNQASSDPKVTVAVRIRPLISRELRSEVPNINWGQDGCLLQQLDPNTGEYIKYVLPHAFDHVFSMDQTTRDVYDRVVAPIVDQAFGGYNGTVLCYGQTSSGKTFTLYGNEHQEGILSMTAQHLFQRIKKDNERSYIIRLGLLEIYNEKVSDLLCEDAQNQKEVIIVESKGSIVPKGAVELEILKPEDMLAAMQTVQKHRRVGETRLNQDSSRSHTVMRIIMESVPKTATTDENTKLTVTTALLNFVDLAGSEKAKDSGAVGDRFKEATFINKSLMTLSQVVLQLSQQDAGMYKENLHNMSLPLVTPSGKGNTALFPPKTAVLVKKQNYINFRDSKLTRILQSSLCGNAFIGLICTITPAAIEETHSTLRFAKDAKHIRIEPTVNHLLASESDYKQKIHDLQQSLTSKSIEVDDLKRKLEVFSNFAHTAPQEPCKGLDNQVVDRRRTICSSTLPFTRRQNPYPAPPSWLSLHSVAEEGIFQLPNVPPPPTKRSSCGDMSPFCDDSKLSKDVEPRQAKKTLVGEFKVPEGKKLKREFLSDAGVQTEIMGCPQDTKRLRLEYNPKETPPSVLRLQRTNLRMACEDEQNEKAELKEFHANEIEALQEEGEALKNALALSERKREEMTELMNMFRTEAGAVTALLTTLKESLEIDVHDAETETEYSLNIAVAEDEILRKEDAAIQTETGRPEGETAECGTCLMDIRPESNDTWTETYLELVDVGTVSHALPEVTDAFTETERVTMADFGIMAQEARAEMREVFTETEKKEFVDFGIMAQVPVSASDVFTETGRSETTDAEVMTDGQAEFTHASTETEKIEPADVGIMAQVPIPSRDVYTETRVIETVDFGITAEVSIPSRDVCTETRRIETVDFGITAEVSIPSRDVCTETRRIETVDFGITAEVAIPSRDVCTETRRIEMVESGITAEVAIPSRDVCTETRRIETVDFGITAEVAIPSRDVCTETRRIEMVESGITAEVAIPSRDVCTETRRIKMVESGITAEVVIPSRDVCTETRRIEMVESGITAQVPIPSRDVQTETRRIQTIDSGITAQVPIPLRDVYTETRRVETVEAEIMVQEARTETQEGSTQTTENHGVDDATITRVERRDFGVHVQPYRVNRQSQTDSGSSYDAMVASHREMRRLCKTYQVKMDSAARSYNKTLDNEKTKIKELESKMVLKESEKEILEHQIVAIEKAYTDDKPKEFKEVQCDLFKDQLEKAMTGKDGMLPVDYPRVDVMGAKIQSQQRTIERFQLDKKIQSMQGQAWLKQTGESEPLRKIKKPDLLVKLDERNRAKLLPLSQKRPVLPSSLMSPPHPTSLHFGSKTPSVVPTPTPPLLLISNQNTPMAQHLLQSYTKPIESLSPQKSIPPGMDLADEIAKLFQNP